MRKLHSEVIEMKNMNVDTENSTKGLSYGTVDRKFALYPANLHSTLRTPNGPPNTEHKAARR